MRVPHKRMSEVFRSNNNNNSDGSLTFRRTDRGKNIIGQIEINLHAYTYQPCCVLRELLRTDKEWEKRTVDGPSRTCQPASQL